MNQDERLELLWTHYNRQIDENRAVGKALDELIERVTELEDELNSRAD